MTGLCQAFGLAAPGTDFPKSVPGGHLGTVCINND